MIVQTNTITISVSAAPHARSAAAGNGCLGVVEDLLGQRGVRALERVRVRRPGRADREQQRRGLAGGAGDGQHRAANDAGKRGREHDRYVVRHRRAPSASLACRRSSGTSFSISSVERITIGNIRRAEEPANPAKPGETVRRATQIVAMNRPITIDGTPVMTSAMNRMTPGEPARARRTR